MSYEWLYAGDEFDECGDVLEENIDFKIHGWLSFFPPVVIAVVITFRVDSAEEELQKLGCAFERFLAECEDGLKETIHDVAANQQIWDTFEILKVFIVRLLGSIEYLLH